MPSALDNFITQFFGTLTKTEINGQVTWTLPCDLEIGLENNPRQPTEGLACYFLRLFNDGIVGATGPTGPSGEDGSDGANAYTVTLASFTQPTVSEPSLTIRTAYNPAMLISLYVFIATSGWYQIQSAAADGTLVLTLIEAVSGAAGTISAGKLVVPTGPRGQSITGPVGPQGPKGDTGSPGVSYTETNGVVTGSGANYALDVTHTRVVFGVLNPEITLPSAGQYLVRVTIGVLMANTAAAYPNPEELEFRLYNATTAAIVPNSTVITFDLGPEEQGQVTIDTIIDTASANNTIQLYGKVAQASQASVVPAQTRIVYARIAG